MDHIFQRHKDVLGYGVAAGYSPETSPKFAGDESDQGETLSLP
jgi:hypothetical protein